MTSGEKNYGQGGRPKDGRLDAPHLLHRAWTFISLQRHSQPPALPWSAPPARSLTDRPGSQYRSFFRAILRDGATRADATGRQTAGAKAEFPPRVSRKWSTHRR